MTEIHETRRHGLPRLRPRGAGVRGLSLHRLRHLHLPHLHLPRRHACAGSAPPRPRTRSPSGTSMTAAAIARSTIAPLFAEPTPPSRAGDAARARRDGRGPRAARETGAASASDLDGYEGWIHAGYAARGRGRGGRRAGASEAEGWSIGASLELGGAAACACRSGPGSPSRVRDVRLPDGRRGCLVAGLVPRGARAMTARAATPRSGGRSSTSPARPTSGAE